jgi:hypothetical protein
MVKLIQKNNREHTYLKIKNKIVLVGLSEGAMGGGRGKNVRE